MLTYSRLIEASACSQTRRNRHGTSTHTPKSPKENAIHLTSPRRKYRSSSLKHSADIARVRTINTLPVTTLKNSEALAFHGDTVDDGPQPS
jgi:hypothetical protein